MLFIDGWRDRHIYISVLLYITLISRAFPLVLPSHIYDRNDLNVCPSYTFYIATPRCISRIRIICPKVLFQLTGCRFVQISLTLTCQRALKNLNTTLHTRIPVRLAPVVGGSQYDPCHKIIQTASKRTFQRRTPLCLQTTDVSP